MSDRQLQRVRQSAQFMSENLGFKLCRVRGKLPVGKNWQHRPISPSEIQPGEGVGLLHHLSNTVTLDVDSELARAAFQAIGLDLDYILLSSKYAIIGNPDKGTPKPIFRNTYPGGGRVVLNWPKLGGKPTDKQTIFEFRGGDGHYQDVLPPSVHPDTLEPYRWRGDVSPTSQDDLPPLLPVLADVWKNWTEYRPIMERACPWASQPAAPQPVTRRFTGGYDDSVQVAFNRQYAVSEILERNGYEPNRQRTRWTAPNSSTRTAGVVLLDDKVFSHHGSDILGDEKPHDAFDVFCILEHSGNRKSAWRAAQALLGIQWVSHEPTRLGQVADSEDDIFYWTSQSAGIWPGL